MQSSGKQLHSAGTACCSSAWQYGNSCVLSTVKARILCLHSNCSEIMSQSLSHCGRKLRIICHLLLHLFCVPTLRFSQLCDYHVMDTVYPPFPLSRLFSHAPYPNRQKCLAFSEHLTLSVTVQATNERILQRSCCEKLMITHLVYIPYPPPASKHLNKTKERNK